MCTIKITKVQFVVLWLFLLTQKREPSDPLSLLPPLYPLPATAVLPTVVPHTISYTLSEEKTSKNGKLVIIAKEMILKTENKPLCTCT